MDDGTCKCEEQPCLCDEIQMIAEFAEGTKVHSSARLFPHMFDIGVGESIQDGTQVVNVVLHGTEGPQPDGSTILTLSFDKQASYKLIAACIQAYNFLWSKDDNE